MHAERGGVFRGGVLLLAALLWWGCRDTPTRPKSEEPRPETPGGECTSNCNPPPQPLDRQPRPNPILAENQLPGDPQWQSGFAADEGELEFYTSTESVEAGESLGVKVSTPTERTLTATLYRMGYYGGAKARKVWSGGPWRTGAQAACPRDVASGRIECDWKDTFSIPIDSSWVSGLYVLKLTREDGGMRYTPFVIRDKRAAELLYTPNFTTYQAYNTWGGTSLYYDASGTTPFGRAREVSFNRPYNAGNGAGKTFFLELGFIQLLEQHGYDVTYGTQLDFLRFSNFLEGIGAFIGAAQDEYWPEQERDQLDAALAGGKMSLAYFGGNGGYWRVRFQPDSKGRPLRNMACYKNEQKLDPQPGTTVRFRDPPNERPESQLFGVMYEGWQIVMFPLVVADDAHWLFEGTGLRRGTPLTGLVGYEYDRHFPELPGAPSGLNVSMKSPVVSAEGVPSYSTTVDRTLPSGRLVFSAGTIYWGLAMSPDPELRDARVERMTLNVLERALAHRRPPRTLPAVTGPGPVSYPPAGQWARSVEAFAGQAGAPGFQDGPAAQARFQAPTGLAVTPAGEVVVADTGNHRIRLIQADAAHTVITLAGNGQPGFRDGPGEQAMFRSPTSVAVGPAGEIYVADSDNHVIRQLQRGATGWTVSTVAGRASQGGFADGAGSQAKFFRPLALATDAAGNLYIVDEMNNRLRMLRAGTQEVVTLAGSGGAGRQDSALGKEASFFYPTALAAGEDVLYMLDAASQLVRRISLKPPYAVDTLAGRQRGGVFGFADGAGSDARFRAQLGMTVAADGGVVVADSGNFRIRKLLPGAQANSWRVVTLAGSGLAGTRLGPGDVAELAAPTGLATGAGGRIYVSDSYNHAIRVILP
ncbi:MAG TPA: N,N-dimethylformamidase beta subunit family domain-containing protein [Archangium sp.]|uniref:N,N-dimethylformamidase beta subunit family domain-containing protein n=1 Tax=Archangium sp. TaxID=1872627 RepID=UPI002E2ECB29|nr:N,N-dimethylformamidase beta subunit family domain-containing protein [Archangium sp.]HEX5745620.1 N,N-dimethylformamidase beta subunit family domain-containing protein [Archangium sp.]